jgi:hypothetical protein
MPHAFIRLLILAILLTALLPAPVLAEGPLSGGTRIYLDKAPAGPFTISSFAAPNPPVTTDNIWITVQVRDDIKAVTDARVWVTVTPRDLDAPQTTLQPQRREATHDLAASNLDYTAFLPVPAPGSYDVLIEMEHPEGSGRVSYVATVTEPLTNYILLFMGIPFLLIALWLARRFGFRLPTAASVLSGDDAPLIKETTKP